MIMDSPDKKKLKSRIINFVFFGLLLVLLVSTTAKSWLLKGVLSTGLFSAKIENTESGTAAMPLTFRTSDSHVESTENLRGKVVFINFWASWCPPCIAEMPSMSKMYDKLKNDPDFAFVFINMDDDVTAARNFLQQHRYDFPLHKPVGFIPTDLYTGTLPTTIVLNKSGEVVMKHSGMANYNSKKFLKQMQDLK